MFADVSTAQNILAGKSILKLAWSYLQTPSCIAICHTSTAMVAYVPFLLCGISHLASWESLRTIGPVTEESSSTLSTQAYCLSALLILFDFDMGNLIRCLGGIYSHKHITMDPIIEAVEALRHRLRCPVYPAQD